MYAISHYHLFFRTGDTKSSPAKMERIDAMLLPGETTKCGAKYLGKREPVVIISFAIHTLKKWYFKA